MPKTKFKVSFLSDYVYDSEKDELIIIRSSSRLMAFLSFMFAFIIACSAFLESVSFSDITPIVLVFLGYSLGQKTFNKALEMFGQFKSGKNDTSE